MKKWPGLFYRGEILWYKVKNEDGEWENRSSGLSRGHEKQARHKQLEEQGKCDAVRHAKQGEAGPLTARLYLERWCEVRDANERLWNRDHDVARIRNYVIPRIGHLMLDEVRPRDIQRLVRDLVTDAELDLAPRTIRHIYNVTNIAFHDAVADELISTTPCVLKRGDLPAKKDKDPTWRASAYYNRRQCELLLSDRETPIHRRLFWAFLIFTGSRFGEAAGVKWKHYDPDHEPLGKILIAESYNTCFQKLKETKTGQPREVPVHPLLARLLAEWKLSGWEALMGRRATPEDLIFPVPAMREIHAIVPGSEKLALAARATQLRETGQTLDAIAVEIGVSAPTVHRLLRLHKRGVVRHPPKLVPRKHGEFRDAYSEMWYYKVACERLSLPRKRIHDFRRTLITLATENGADPAVLKIITHAPSGDDAFDLYRSYPWPRRCAEMMKFPVRVEPPREVTHLPAARSQVCEKSSELGTVFGTVTKKSSKSKTKARRPHGDSNP